LKRRVRRAELREVVALSLREEVSLGFRRMDRRISLGAYFFLSRSLNSVDADGLSPWFFWAISYSHD